MRKTYLALICLFTLVSCSNHDEQEVNNEQPLPKMINLKIDFDEHITNTIIQLFDENDMPLNIELYRHHYQNARHINLFIKRGAKFTIYTYDEGVFSYNYRLINSNGTIQFEGEQQGIVENVLTRTYILQ